MKEPKEDSAALLRVDPSAAVKTEALPNKMRAHSMTCDLVGFRQGYNAPPVCSCGAEKERP